MRISAVAAALVAACASKGGTDVERGSAVDHGRALFADPRASSSPSNAFACATCHPSDAAAAKAGEARVFPGAALGGATKRMSLWGGARVDLLESINDCRLFFMDAPAPWTSDDEDARAMFAYLQQLAGAGDAVSFTVLHAAPDLPAGDPVAGEAAYANTCAPCHGSAHNGAGRLVTFAPKLPDDVDATHASLAPADRRLVYLRKAREGAFVLAAGAMPPFSREVLPDAQLASILAYLGQY